MSSLVTNHSLPSAAFAKVGPKEEGDPQGNAPSVASQSVGSTRRAGSDIQASIWLTGMRSRPQAVYSHNERSSSSVVQ